MAATKRQNVTNRLVFSSSSFFLQYLSSPLDAANYYTPCLEISTRERRENKVLSKVSTKDIHLEKKVFGLLSNGLGESLVNRCDVQQLAMS